jgi:peptide/nickel transport system permease protein
VALALTRRLLLIGPILFGMSITVFSIIRLVPGDPVLALLGLNATPKLVVQTRHQLGLDLPAYVQYIRWIGNALHGDLGFDYRSGRPITELILAGLPVTGELVALSLLLAICIGVPLGMIAAIKRDRWPDRLGLGISMGGISVPDFWLGIMLILVFSLLLRMVPSSGFIPLLDDPLQNLQHMILPALALCAGLTAVLIRITRTAMLDVLQNDYIRFARAKGLGEVSVIVRHGLRNAAIPIVTVIGMQAGYLFGATVVIEQVFSLPGLGRLVLDSTLARNYPLIQGSVLVLGLLFIVANLVVDSLYVVLDPRLKTRAA